MTMALVLLLPHATEPLAPAQAFLPAYQSVLLLATLATAAMLIGQLSAERTRGLAVLGTAYSLAAFIAVPTIFALFGLLPPGTLVGLDVVGHAAFPLLLLVYAVTKRDSRPLSTHVPVGWLTVGAALVVALIGTLLATRVSALVVWGLAFGALAALLLGRPYRRIDLWLMVVAAAGAGDVGLSLAFTARPFDLGFYAGRAFGLIAALFLLVMLLYEARQIPVRLIRELASHRASATRQLQRLFETSLDLILVTDGYGRFTQVSPSSVRLLDYQPEEMVGRLATEFIYPADLEPTRNEMRAARRGNVMRNFRSRYVHRDGSPVTLTWTGVWSEKDRLHFFIGRDVSDIEEARRSSQETAEVLRAIVDTSHQAIIAISPTGDILLWSKAAERMFGYTAEEVQGGPYPRRTTDPAAAAEQSGWIRRVMAGETLANLSFKRLHKDGTERVLYGAAAPFHDARGAIRGAAYVLEDVTAKIATEEMLRQAQKMEAVGQLTGGVAHDFNNILMVILANVEDLQDSGNLTPEQSELLAAIATSGKRAAEMTHRLLAFSRKQRLMPQPTNLSDLVVSIGKMLRRSLGEQIEIGSALAEDLWAVNVDRSQVEAALVNLCVNARDAMPEGGRLLLETANAQLDEDYCVANPGAAPGDYVMLAVSDTGTGIPSELLDKVFEPFFTTKEVGKGTGLGLSMVYGFLKQSNGHIRIYSEVGRGTTIRMYLPRIADAVGETEVEAIVPPTGREHVLLVEDDDLVRATVLRQLRGLGYCVTAARDGTDALSHLENGDRFDLILSDTVMPGLDGPHLVGITRQRWPAMKVLLMTGYSELATRNNEAIAQDLRVLSKPFRRLDLALRVREAIERPT